MQRGTHSAGSAEQPRLDADAEYMRGALDPESSSLVRVLPHPREESVAATATSRAPSRDDGRRGQLTSGTRRASASHMGREIQERAYRFGRDVMHYAIECESMSSIGRELLRQLFRSATSVGANLQEAQAAVSRRDFIHKIGLARKEAFETRYWLRLRRDMCPDDQVLPRLQHEADELCRVLSAILISARRNQEEERDSS